MKKTILSITLSVIAGASYAQQKNMTDTIHSIKEVVIEANIQKKAEMLKLGLPLNHMPISISTVSAKDLDMRGITNLEDAIKFLPGARMQTTYGAFQTFSVRGFSNAVIMVDGVRDERTVINSNPFPDLTSIESLELLKGPASVLYGHSVVGGVLNIVRKSPAPQQEVNAKISYGSWQNKQANMDFGGSLVGKLNYRANINYADQEGWRDNGNKRLSAYLALGYQLDKTSNLTLRAGANRDFYGTEIGLAPNMSNKVYNQDGTVYLEKGEMQPNLNRKARYNNESDFFYNKNFNVSLKYDKMFANGMKFENYFSYNKDDIDYFGTEELSYLESDLPIYKHYYMDGDKKKYICLDTVALTFPLRFSHLTDMLVNQSELSGKFYTGNLKHNYLGGYTFTQIFRNSFSGYKLAPETDPLNSSYNVYGPGLYSHVAVNNPHSMGYMESNFGLVAITKYYSHGVYLQDLIEISDKWKLMLAGRYDFYKYMSESNVPTYDGKRKYHKSDQTSYNQNNTSAFSYRVGAVYLPHKDVSIYGSMASFFTPYRNFYSANTIYVNADGNRFYPEAGKEIFKPQDGYQGELGARYSYKTWLQATASVYYIRRNNETKTLATKYKDPEDNDKEKTVTGQVGTSDSKGFELEVSLFPVSGFTTTLGYGYIDAKVRKIAENKFTSLNNDLNVNKGKQLATIPKNTFFAAGSYYIQNGLFKDLGFNFTVSYMDKVYRSLDNTTYFPSYWITDLGASYKLKNNIRLGVNVNNVFNETYYNQALGNQMVPSAPCNFLASVSYSLR